MIRGLDRSGNKRGATLVKGQIIIKKTQVGRNWPWPSRRIAQREQIEAGEGMR